VGLTALASKKVGPADDAKAWVAAIPSSATRPSFSPIPVRNVTMLPSFSVVYCVQIARCLVGPERRRLDRLHVARSCARHSAIARARKPGPRHLGSGTDGAHAARACVAGVLHRPLAATPHRDCAGKQPRSARGGAARRGSQRHIPHSALGSFSRHGRGRPRWTRAGPWRPEHVGPLAGGWRVPGRGGFDHLGAGSVGPDPQPGRRRLAKLGWLPTRLAKLSIWR
jgi:hypothetical protein